ncbi:hypothetical protein MTO96_017109 [Rhipicephalus appendiculatus]
MTAQQSRSVPSRLSSALASNTNLCSVIIKGLQLGNDDLDALADAARKSRRLTEFRYMSCTALDRPVVGCVIPEESPVQARTASLTLHWRKYRNRRTATPVVCRQRLVSCWASLKAQRPLWASSSSTTTPHLLELVRDGALANTDEAKAMIRNARKKLRMYSVHEFMRTVGVVAHSVECHPRRDGRMQLSDINEDCWSLICSYLSLTDVAETAAAPPGRLIGNNCSSAFVSKVARYF